VVETVEPAYTSQQCSKCGCTLDENRDGQQFEYLDCSYSVNADYNAVVRLRLTGSKREAVATATNVARKLALKSSEGRSPPLVGRSVSIP
jgi:transposase